MHKITEILNGVVDSLSEIALNAELVPIERYKPDTPKNHPVVRVVMGPEETSEDDYQQDLRELTVFTDIYLSSTKNTLEDDALIIREQIESIFRFRTGLSVDGLEKIRLTSQDEPNFNDPESDDYSASVRVSWLFTYTAPAIY